MAGLPRELRELNRSEVAKHNTYEDQWIIVNDKVYDISKFAKRHPGGKVISFYRGEDATEAVNAFHPDLLKTEKYMKPLLIGKLEATSAKQIEPVVNDFRDLREQLQKEGMFKANIVWYALYFMHVIALEVLALYLIANWGQYRWAFWLTAVVLAVSQIQAGWLQHDFGHLSVFHGELWWNTLLHHVLIGGLKGASSAWWKSRHNRHHAKTNILKRDPDIHTEPVFVWSTEMAKSVNFKALTYQPVYWWLFGPPTVTTVLFVYQNIHFMITQKKWVDLFWSILFFWKYCYFYSIYLSAWDCFILYASMRLLESHWFTWITSMNHLPREMQRDTGSLNWVSTHLLSTQNISSGLFHDWFTGHLNYQIEHHLFPTMPRHNYPLVSARIKALCQKHGLNYRVRSMYEAGSDIIEKLSNVGAHIDKQYHLKSK